METWLERAERFGDVSFDRASPNYIYAASISDMKDKIIRGLKAGLATTAIIAAIGIPLVYRDNVAQLIDRMRGNEISLTEQDLIESMREERLNPSVMPIPVGEPVPKAWGGDVKYKEIASELSGVEGNYNYVYDDGSVGAKPWSKSKLGKPTLGIGHWMNGSAEDRNLFQELFGNEVDYDKLMSNQQTLTEPQVLKLFKHDSGSRISWLLKKIPKFKSFNAKTQAAIMSAKYRGDLGPNTIGFINQGKWLEAGDELLNHTEYKEVKRKIKNGEKTNKAGIVPRLEGIADVLRSNAKN